MAIGFTRPYRLLDRLFPASGISNQNIPAYVDGTVIPTWDALKSRPGDVTFDGFALVSNANAADFTLGANEPPEGKVRLIYAGAVTHLDGTNVRNVSVRFVASTSAVDPWGNFFTMAGGTRVVGALEVTGARWANLPRIPPVFRGINLSFVFHGMTGAGEQVQCHYVYVDIPGELLTVEERP